MGSMTAEFGVPEGPAASMPPPPPPPPPAAPSSADADLSYILAQMDTDDAERSGGTIQVAPGAPAADLSNKLTDPRDLERPSAASAIVIESEGGLNFDPTLAGFDKRFIGILVDTLVLSLAMLPGLTLMFLGGILAAVGALLALLGFSTAIWVTARKIVASGQSIGNTIANTRVVDGINGSNIDMGRAVLRTAVRHLVSPVLLLGFLVSLPDPQRRTFHDRLTQTVVIGRDREVWTVDDE
ncbi:MAG: putative RDD family membrane protein YckC [Ilumatobacter sp.]|jgi:uncharacterized RDD family membrane protein YckC